MSQSVQGSIQAGVNLTTTFASGTAGKATETNNLGTSTVTIGPGESAGRQFTDCWTQTYSNISAPFDIDLTALPGIGGRIVNFTPSGVRLLMAVNSDPEAGHDFKIGPAASNGFAAPWDDATAFATVYGGMPGAGVTNGQPTGNESYQTNCTPAGWTVDATHKALTIDPGSNTIASLTLVIAG